MGASTTNKNGGFREFECVAEVCGSVQTEQELLEQLGTRWRHDKRMECVLFIM